MSQHLATSYFRGLVVIDVFNSSSASRNTMHSAILNDGAGSFLIHIYKVIG
jgi:hypothetical protein